MATLIVDETKDKVPEAIDWLKLKEILRKNFSPRSYGCTSFSNYSGSTDVIGKKKRNWVDYCEEFSVFSALDITLIVHEKFDENAYVHVRFDSGPGGVGTNMRIYVSKKKV